MTDITASHQTGSRRTEPPSRDGPLAAASLHRRRHPRHWHLRADRTGSQTGRRRGLAAVPGGLRRGGHHRFQLPRTGDQISEGRRRRALHSQGVRHPLRHFHRRLRRHVFRHHLGLDRLARLLGQSVQRLRSRLKAAAPASSCSASHSWPSWRRSISAASAKA